MRSRLPELNEPVRGQMTRALDPCKVTGNNSKRLTLSPLGPPLMRSILSMKQRITCRAAKNWSHISPPKLQNSTVAEAGREASSSLNVSSGFLRRFRI